MTSVLEMTVEEIKRKLEKLKDFGWVRSYRKGDTGEVTLWKDYLAMVRIT
ncbi:MAG: hypothetical protein ACTSV2_08495 [Candidatus Thorarchaeota archaeon]